MPGRPSQVDARLFALINGVLRERYDTLDKDDEKEERVLPLLRSVGTLLSSISPAEIVGFLSTVQGTLIPWIADEREVLSDDLHDEIVSFPRNRSVT